MASGGESFVRVPREGVASDDDTMMSQLLELLKALVDVNRRNADNTGRAATSLEAIAPTMTRPLTVEQVAELAGVTVKTVYRWTQEGLLKPLADGVRPLLFDPAEVNDFLRRRRRGRRGE
jgi:excisionase family DNA binding protein